MQRGFEYQTPENWKTKYWKYPNQILANRGPALRFVIEANTEALVSKLNSRRSEYVMVRRQSI